MADEIERLLQEGLNLSRREIVEELVNNGDVDVLTKVKMRLVERGRQLQNFPKGELYVRRKPKGCSNYYYMAEINAAR